MIAWTRGVGRLIDALEKVPATKIGTKRLGIMDARGTVTALWASAPSSLVPDLRSQKREALEVKRVGVSQTNSGDAKRTFRRRVRSCRRTWHGLALNSYATQVGVLPFDQHLLTALVAPRAALVAENAGIEWLGSESVWGCQGAARTVWIELAQNASHNHCMPPETTQSHTNAFIDRFLKDRGDVNTAVFYTAGDFKYEEKDLVDWDVQGCSAMDTAASPLLRV